MLKTSANFPVRVAEVHSTPLQHCPEHSPIALPAEVLWQQPGGLPRLPRKLPPHLQGLMQREVIGEGAAKVDPPTLLQHTEYTNGSQINAFLSRFNQVFLMFSMCVFGLVFSLVHRKFSSDMAMPVSLVTWQT